MDGHEIQEVLGIRPGPLVGQAWRYLLELRLEHGPLGKEEATKALLRWAEEQGITPGKPEE